jgi:hypothetical protein
LAPRALPRFIATTDPSAGLSPSPRFAFQLARLPCFRGFSPRDEEPFPVSTHGLARVPPPSTPPDGAHADRVRGHLLPSPKLRRLGVRIALLEASTGRSLVVAARVLAHPATQGFVGGLHRRDLPRRRHPSYAASTFYRFRTFTLRIHGYLQASLSFWWPLTSWSDPDGCTARRSRGPSASGASRTSRP